MKLLFFLNMSEVWSHATSQFGRFIFGLFECICRITMNINVGRYPDTYDLSPFIQAFLKLQPFSMHVCLLYTCKLHFKLLKMDLGEDIQMLRFQCLCLDGQKDRFFWKPRRGHPRFASWLGVISVCSNIGKCELRAFGFSKLKERILYCVYLEEHKLCWQRSDGEVRPNCFQQRFSKRANTCPVCTWTVIWCVFSRAFEWTENVSDMVLKQTTKKCYSAAGYVFRVVCSEWNQCLN